MNDRNYDESGFDPASPQADARPRSLWGLLKGFKADCVKLAKQEADLAKAEMRTNARRAGWLSAAILTGVAVAVVGLTVFALGLASVVALLFGSDTGAVAAGQLVVGSIMLAGGTLCAAIAAKRLPEQSVVPRQTIASVREDLRFFRRWTR